MSEETAVSGGNEESSTGDTGAAASSVQSSDSVQGDGAGNDQAGGVGASGESSDPSLNQYQPNFKFNVMDKEHEIEEWLRPLVSDTESEKKMKDLLSKAYGLDFVKPKYEATKTELGTTKQQMAQLTKELQQAGKYIQNGDLGTFFKQLNIDDEKILKYAIERLSYYEMPPEERQRLDNQMSERQRLYALEQENATYKQQSQQASLNDMNSRLGQMIEHPQVKSAAQTFDQKAGRPGAFRDAVIRHAVAEYQITGKDLQPHEAVGSFLQLYGYGAQPNQVAANQGQQAAQPTVARPQTLPKVGSSNGMAPVRKQAKNLDDLRKMRDSFPSDEI